MTSFRFALAGLLRLRSFELDERRRELVQETEAWRGALADSEAGERRAREVEEREARAITGGVDAQRAEVLRSDALSGRAEARAAAEHVETSSANVEESRERVQEAWRRLRTLERLHERALEQHRRGAERREQRDLDEAARARRPSWER